jgi:hypothetical protein
MRAQFGAKFAAVCSVAGKLFNFRRGVLTAVTLAASTLAGCMPATVPLAGADPADPNVRVAAVGYRSTVAPYTRLRPTAPTGWREHNERVAPAPKSNQ